MSILDRLRSLFSRGDQDDAGAYEPLDAGDGRPARPHPHVGVDWLEYGIFVVLGVAMLWSWNMFLAAAPYFQTRFEGSEYLLKHFQPSIITVSTVATLGTTAILTKLQANASYPKRVAVSLVLNTIVFVILAVLTVAFLDISADAYFAILLVLVFAASTATGFCQNGVFAYASGLGPSEYTQAVMTGQGIAGVAPCIVQIVSVLSVPPEIGQGIHGRGRDDGTDAGPEPGSGNGTGAGAGAGGVQESPKSACAYFTTAAVVSVVALLAFGFLLRRHPEEGKSRLYTAVAEDIDAAEDLDSSQLPEGKSAIGLWKLFLKLKWLAPAVLIAFAVTMQFAVFTPKILSVKDPETASRLFQRVCFIPLSFLFWNLGDLVGKTAPVVPLLNIVHKQKTVFVASLARLVFIPMYYLCNVGGEGAVVPSDFFYLFVVQFLFGFTGGWIGTVCMMGPSYWVEESERGAAGSLMVLSLVSGLSIGSIISFAAA